MTAAVSQQLWISGGALVQRAQEPNIPFGESLTSIMLQFQEGIIPKKFVFCPHPECQSINFCKTLSRVGMLVTLPLESRGQSVSQSVYFVERSASLN